MSRPRLSARTVPRAALDAVTRDAMWALLAEVYADVTRARFDADLDAKGRVILVEEGVGGPLRGFSTLSVEHHELDGQPFVAIYSGDTVIAPGHWGGTALQGAFFFTLLEALRDHPDTPVYWFLISKGYKTYMLLARNFPHFWPRRDAPTPAREAAILDALCRQRFGDAWDPARGTLRFDAPQGRLREGVAAVDADALRDPDIAFFAERNPGWARGDELCCLGAVDQELVTSYTAKMAARRAAKSARAAK